MMTSLVGFRLDIVASLPYEIRFRIFKHLPLDRVFQAHRVCRCWRYFLTDPPFGDDLLRPWTSQGGMNLQIPPGLTSTEILSAKADHIHAFKNGLFSYMDVGNWMSELSCRGDMAVSSCTAYSHGRLAWISRDDVVVKVLHLESAKARLYASPSKERIIRMALSQSLVVLVLASPKCVLWRLDSKFICSFGLAPGTIEQLVVVLDTVALSRNVDGNPRQIFITTWNKNDPGSTGDFALDIRSPYWKNYNSDHRYLMIHPDGNSIIFLEMVVDIPAEGFLPKIFCVFSTRADLDGKNQSTVVFDCSSAGFNLWPYSDRFQPVLPQEIEYNVMVTIGVVVKMAQNPSLQPAYLVYDLKRNVFWLDTHIFVEPDGTLIRPQSFRWKDVAFSPYRNVFGNYSCVIGRKMNNLTKLEMSNLLPSMLDPSTDARTDSENCLLYGDERWLVIVSAKIFVIWCFDQFIVQPLLFDQNWKTVWT